MKTHLLISFFSFLFLYLPGSDKKKIKELEKLVQSTEILEEGGDFSEKLKVLRHAINLYESIERKELIPDEVVKGVGIFYLYSREREKASEILFQYLKKYPQDGEAVFYRGVLSKFKNEKYCHDFNRSENLGFEITPLLKFIWLIKENECL